MYNYQWDPSKINPLIYAALPSDFKPSFITSSSPAAVRVYYRNALKSKPSVASPEGIHTRKADVSSESPAILSPRSQLRSEPTSTSATPITAQNEVCLPSCSAITFPSSVEVCPPSYSATTLPSLAEICPPSSPTPPSSPQLDLISYSPPAKRRRQK